MKKVLLLVALFATTISAAMAQKQVDPVHADQPPAPVVIPELPFKGPLGTNRPELMESAASEFQGYLWFTRHFRRWGPDTNDIATARNIDSNTRNFHIPLKLSDGATLPRVSVPGFGGIFSPGSIPDLFGPEYSDTTGLQGATIATDYIEQFRDAGEFYIDSVVTLFFNNPNDPNHFFGATYFVYATPDTVQGMKFNPKTYFNSPIYKSNGFVAGRSRMKTKFVANLTDDPAALDSTLTGPPGQQTINGTKLDFTDPRVSPSGPLHFAANEAAIMMLVNDDAEPVDGPDRDDNDRREYQTYRSFIEYRSGEPDVRNPTKRYTALDTHKVMGVMIYRTEPTIGQRIDTIWSIARGIVYTLSNPQNPNQTLQVPALLDPAIWVYGSVNLGVSGVRYHFGNDVAGQGLGEIVPNPVRENGRIAFSLKETGNVTIDLYDLGGQHVTNLVNNLRFGVGNFSAPIEAANLTNGMYVVRMIVNDKVYTTKVTVAR